MMASKKRKVDPSIFRAYDVRGKTPSQLNEPVAQLIGQAIATKALAQGIASIAIGRDGRSTSPDLSASLIDGITSGGIDAVDLGMVPTPVAYWAAMQKTGGSSAVVTGSHNPHGYNGIKATLNGLPLAEDEVQEIRKLVEESRFASSGVAGSCEQVDGIADKYIAELALTHKLKRKVKVVVDCGNGVAGPFYPEALRQLGCEVVEIYSEVDGSFPNHHPDPAVPANFKQAVKLMEKEDAEMVMAFDGDGDRLGIWLPGSGILYPDRILMLLARQLLARLPRSEIFYDVKCSVNVARYIKEHGGKPRLCRTGHSFMKLALAKANAPLGGELSGHFFFNEGNLRYDDALVATARVLEMASEHESASALAGTVPDSCATPEYTVPIDGATPHEFVAALVERGGLDGDPDINTLDGIRAEWRDGFGLVRASNTTASLIMRFEGSNEKACSAVRERFRAVLLAERPGLQLPF